MLVLMNKILLKYWIYLLWVVCSLSGIFGLWIYFPWLHQWAPDNSSALASWIQAFGSIAVIYAGFEVAKLQLRETSEKQDLRDREAHRKEIRNKYFILANNIAKVYSWAKTVNEADHILDFNDSFVIDICIENIHKLESLKYSDYPEVADILDVDFLILDLNNVKTTIEKEVQLGPEQDLKNSLIKKQLRHIQNYSKAINKVFNERGYKYSTEKEELDHRKKTKEAVERMRMHGIPQNMGESSKDNNHKDNTKN